MYLASLLHGDLIGLDVTLRDTSSLLMVKSKVSDLCFVDFY